MDRIRITLHTAKQGHAAMRALWGQIKLRLMAGRSLCIEVCDEKRSDAQNRLLHARISDIAKHIEWAGKRRDVDTWKRLLTAAWLRARGESIEILPAIDGHGVDVVFRRTSNLTRAESAELADYVMAYGDEDGVQWSPASLGRDNPDEVSNG